MWIGFRLARLDEGGVGGVCSMGCIIELHIRESGVGLGVDNSVLCGGGWCMLYGVYNRVAYT